MESLTKLLELLIQDPELFSFIDIHAKDNQGNTLLMLAAKKGLLDMVKMLLSKSKHVDVNAENDEGDTALSFSVQEDHYDVAKYLIDHGANVNLGSEDSIPIFGAIYDAIHTDDMSFVQLLLDHGADMNVLCNYCHSNPLCYLVFGDVWVRQDRPIVIQIATALIAKGAHAGREGEFTLIGAADNGMIQLMELLLTNGVPANLVSLKGYCGIDDTALHNAAEYGSTEAVQLLLRYGADLRPVKHDYNDDDTIVYYTPLDLAVKNGHIETARVLRMALLRSRFRCYGRMIGRFIRLYHRVAEIRYRPGGPGYAESLEHFESMCDQQSHSRL